MEQELGEGLFDSAKNKSVDMAVFDDDGDSIGANFTVSVYVAASPPPPPPTTAAAAADLGLQFETLLLGLLLFLLIVTSVVGNILVCVAIATDHSLRKLSNLFLVSLAIADLLVAVLVMPFAMLNDVYGSWDLGETFCELWISSDVMCSTASIVNLCAISLDRYVHIKDPLQYTEWITRRSVPAAIAVIWVTSALISFLPISLDWHSADSSANSSDERSSLMTVEGGKHICALDFSPSYSVISSLISFFIPCVIMVGIYVNVYSFARYHMRSIKEHTKPLIRLRKLTTSMTAGVAEATAAAGSSRNASSQTNNGSSSTSSPPTTTAAATATQPLVVSNGISSEKPSPPLEKGVFARVRRKRKKKVSDGNNPGVMETPLYHEHKAAITIGIIMGVFLLCWTPFFVVNVISGLCKGCISPTLFKVLTWLGYSNSAFNPIIYSIFNTEFREAFAKILTRKMPCCRGGRTAGCDCCFVGKAAAVSGASMVGGDREAHV